jgi:hypothetical protein
MKTEETGKFAQYKGRRYKLLFLGDTSFGKRARLAFLDGSKQFWVDAAKIAPAEDDKQDDQADTQTMPFGKHKGESFSEIPTDYLEWLAKRDNLREPLRSTVTKELEERDDRAEQIGDSDIPF